MVRRIGPRGSSRRPDPPANVLGGKDLCRQVQSCAHDESVAGTNGTEASPIAAIRMDGLRVPTSRAEELRGVVAGGSEGIDLRHALDRKPARKCIHPLIAVLLLDRMTDPTEEGGQSHSVCHPALIPKETSGSS
jgi:hypothetical protein